MEDGIRWWAVPHRNIDAWWIVPDRHVVVWWAVPDRNVIVGEIVLTATSHVREVTEVPHGVPVLTDWALILEGESMIALEEAFAVRVMGQVNGIARILVKWAASVWNADEADARWSSCRALVWRCSWNSWHIRV